VNKTAKAAAERGIRALIPVKQMKIPHVKLKCNKLDEQLAKKLRASQNTEGWWVTPEKQAIVTPQVTLTLPEEKHEQTHLGVDAMVSSLNTSVVSAEMIEITKSIVAKCPICLKNNPLNRKEAPLGVTQQGNSPGDYWQVDFFELPGQNGSRYLLAPTDTFSGWPEAFPCCTNKARERVKILLKEGLKYC